MKRKLVCAAAEEEDVSDNDNEMDLWLESFRLLREFGTKAELSA